MTSLDPAPIPHASSVDVLGPVHSHGEDQTFADQADPSQDQANEAVPPKWVTPDPAPSPDPTTEEASPNGESSGRVAYGILAVYADTLDDLESSRIANENRVRSLVQLGVDERATGKLGELVEELTALEHRATLDLQRALRKHPLGPWVKRTQGIGEKQGARLLAAIGDPYWHTLNDAPRTVSQLWAYCGYNPAHVPTVGHPPLGTHLCNADGQPLRPDQCSCDSHTRGVGADPSSDTGQSRFDTQRMTAGVARTRKRGEQANWSAAAKMRAFLCAEAAVKAGVRKMSEADDTNGYDVAHREAITPLGQVYLDGRAKYADAMHQIECKRCGPAGKPAQPGSPLSEGHKHARSLRLVAKQILKDLWREAQRLHEAA